MYVWGGKVTKKKLVIVGISILLLVVGLSGCMESSSINNSPVTTIYANPINGTVPLTVHFNCTANDTDGHIASYFWRFGDGYRSTKQNPIHIYKKSGNYEVTLIVSDDNGAKDLDIIKIFVNQSESSDENDKEELINLGLLKIDANPDKGFYWPYYLNAPNSTINTTLLVEPCNTGTGDDDPVVHDEAAKQLAEWHTHYAQQLQSPLLVPTFPRSYTNWQIYTHALDRETLQTTLPNIQRIDLQLIAMIDDAIGKLSEKGINVDYKVFIMGFSASGMFTNRFTILHPDRVKAAAIGSPGGWPIAPVEEWQGEILRYHVGISDVQQLTGKPFDLKLFSTIPLFFYMGDLDINDSVPYDDSFVKEDRDLICRLFGDTQVERWPKAEEIYGSVNCSSQFVLYPGAGHNITYEMESDIIEFFLNNR